MIIVTRLILSALLSYLRPKKDHIPSEPTSTSRFSAPIPRKALVEWEWDRDQGAGAGV